MENLNCPNGRGIAKPQNIIESINLSDYIRIDVDFNFLFDLKRSIDIVFYSTKYDDLKKLLGENDYDNLLWFNEMVSQELYELYYKEGFDKSTGKVNICRLDEFSRFIEINRAIVNALGIMGKFFDYMALDQLYSFSVSVLTKWILMVSDIHKEWSNAASKRIDNQAA